MSQQAALQALAGELGGLALYVDPIDLLPYRRDCSVARAGQAELAVQPATTQEVIAIVERAARHGVVMYMRGGGTMYAGGANPHAGGLVIDMSRMHRMLDLDLARGVVVVEPGIRCADLLAQLEPHGQTIGIVPSTGPAAMVGGARSSHA